MKEESTKGRLQLNTKNTKFTTTEELYNFNVDYDIEIVQDFVYFASIRNPNGNCNQKMRWRLGIVSVALRR